MAHQQTNTLHYDPTPSTRTEHLCAIITVRRPFFGRQRCNGQDRKRMADSQPTCCCSVTLLLRFVARKCCSSQVSLVSLNVLPGVLHAEWSTKRTTEPDTAQTERVLTRLVDTASLDSRLHQSSRRVFHNIHVLSLSILCCPCPCCTHNSSWFLG